MIDLQHLQELKIRQRSFLRALGDRVAIVVSGYEKVRNNDVYYTFRQDSTFNYLTGFPEADSVAVFDGREGTYTLLSATVILLWRCGTASVTGLTVRKSILAPTKSTR